MTFSNLYGQKDDLSLLAKNLERIGNREIYLWKELVRQEDELFDKIYGLIFCNTPRIAWHAAWVIDHVSEAEPAKLEPRVPELIDLLPRLKSHSLKRHFTRMLCRHEIPENKMGLLIDVLYRQLSPVEDVAVRALSMQLLFQMASKEPGLQAELASVIESMLEEDCSPGLLSKGKKILHRLNMAMEQRSKQED